MILARGQVAAEASEEEEEERELRRMEMEEEGRAEGERETDALEMAIEKELSSKETSLSHPEVTTPNPVCCHSISQGGQAKGACIVYQ